MGTTGEIVVSDLMFPEGPVWCDDGTVVCTAVAEGALYRVWPAEQRKERIAMVGGGANAAAPAADGGFLVTQNGGIDYTTTGLYADPPPYSPATPGIQRVFADGRVEYLLDDGFRAPNDLVVAADGTLYFTDPPVYPPPDVPAGRVHALAPDGTFRTIASDFAYCNGIALEPDGTIVVVEGHGLMRVGLDGSKEWITEQTGAGGDGFCLDQDGNFYVATTVDHGITVVDPNGKQIDFYPIPDAPGGFGVTTNCCFGGADARTLFATDGVPGDLIAWENMPVPGREVYAWPTNEGANNG
jgi:gluconolactonase